MRFLPHLHFAPLVVAVATFAWLPSARAEKNEPPGDKSGTEKNKGNDAAPDEKKESPSVCVKHTQQARYVNGFDHLVHITNECRSKVSCKVSTDVNPDVQLVSLAPGKATTVLTFRGSPARVFRARVECTFEGAPG